MGANLTPKKTLLLINSAICEDTLKTMNSSCVQMQNLLESKKEEEYDGKRNVIE